MKVDVAVSFYRREHLWPDVASGLDLNDRHIDHVLVVNDEEWGDWVPSWTGATALIDHPHDDPYGLARSNNDGVEFAVTDYVCCIDDDIALAPESLAKNLPLCQPRHLVYGRIAETHPDVPLDKAYGFGRVCDGKFIGSKEQKNALDHLLHWCTGGYFITHKESHDQMGGYDEDLIERGFLDWDYALRWLLEFGPSSVVIGTGGAWHLHHRDEYPERSPRNRQTVGILYNAVLDRYPNLALRENSETAEGIRTAST